MKPSTGRDVNLETLRRIPLIGIGFAIISAFFLSTGALIVKLLVGYPSLQLVIIRSIVQAAIFGPIICAKRIRLSVDGERSYLFGRCLVGCIGQFCAYQALKMIPLGDAVSIQFSSTVFVVLLARLVLKELLTWLQFCAVITCIGGVFLISRPSIVFPHTKLDNEVERIEGVLLAFVVCLAQATISIFLRKLQKTSSSVVVFWLSVFGITVGIPVLLASGDIRWPKRTTEVLLLLLLGVCGTCAQYCMTLAFKLEDAGPVALARTTNIVFSFLYQAAIVHEPILWTSILGASIITVSVTGVALQKWYIQKPDSFHRLFSCARNERIEEIKDLRDTEVTFQADDSKVMHN